MTKSVCVLCLRRFDRGTTVHRDDNGACYQSRIIAPTNIALGQVSHSENTCQAQPGQLDLYSKFLRFTGRHLNISSSESLLQFAKEQNNTTGENVQAFCGNCHALVSHVCDLYAELQTVKLHLLKRVDELGKVTKLSTKAVSLKLSRGLMKTVAEQLNIKTVRQLDLYRKSLILNCKRKTNASTPKVLIPRGLFPEYWKFTFSATQKSLMRLIIVFTLASSKLVSKPVQEQRTEGILKKIGQQRKRQTGRPRGKVYFADIKNHFNEATARVKFGGDVTVKREEGASKEELRADDDDHEDGGFPDTGGDDNDSDWSRGAVSPTGSIDSPGSDVNFEHENLVPTKRRRLRRTRQRLASINSKVKTGSSGESEEEDPTDPEFKSNLEAGKEKRRTPKRPPSLGIKDATIPCKQCKKMFVDKRGLAKHLRDIHNTHLDYICETCGFKSKTYVHFLEHRRVHKIGRKTGREGSKSFEHPDNSNATIPCPKCNRKFIDGRGLSRHLIRVHKSRIEYTCHVCGHKSTSAMAHVAHKSAMHKQQRGPRTKTVISDAFKRTRINRQLATDCKQCGIQFNTHAEFLQHDKSVHNRYKKEFECPICMKQVVSDIHFQRHLLKHEKDSSILRLFHCEVCGKTFFNEETLADHFVTVHEGTYNCSICDTSFPTPKFLRHHLEVHETEKKNFFCNFCFRAYTNEQYWQVHRKSAHVGKERIFCDQDRCAEEFNNVQELNEHLKIHLKEPISTKDTTDVENTQELKTQSVSDADTKPIEGDDPNLATCENTDQQNHENVSVDNYQIFTCTTCSWGFLSKYRLTLHELVHIPYEKEIIGYRCPQSDCSKILKLKDTLISHYTQVHGEKLKPYNCHECGANFSQFIWYKTHLQLHEERKSGRKFICETCGEECKDSVSLNCHRRTHYPKRLKRGPSKSKIRYLGRPRGRPRMKPTTAEELTKEKEQEAETMNLPCDICSTVFEYGWELKKHLEKKHEMEDDKTIQCNFCDLKFVHKQTHFLHVKSIHMQKYKFVCDADRCDGVFKNHLQLNEHLIQVHLLESPQMADSGQNTNKIDNTSENITQIEVKTGQTEADDEENPKTASESVVKVKSLSYCKICNWGFVNAGFVELHELCHIPIVGRAYPCPYCETHFTSISKLTFHYNSSHGNKLKPFKCMECPNRFFTKEGLKLHVYRHDSRRNLAPGEKFVCIECGKSFIDTKCYNNHMKSHDPTNHISCPEGCGEKFVDKNRLNDHLKRKHGKGERYPCPVCGATFVYEYETRKHIEWSHEPPKYECKVCHQKYKRPGALSRHMRYHAPESEVGYICSECGNSYRTEEGLNYHIGSMHTPDHLKKFACPYCPYKSHRRILWKNHLRTCTKSKGIPYDEARFGKPPVVNKPKATPGIKRRPGRPSQKKRKAESDEEEMEEKTTTEEEDEGLQEENDKMGQKVVGAPQLLPHQLPQSVPSSTNVINALLANLTGIPDIGGMSDSCHDLSTSTIGRHRGRDTTNSTIDHMLFHSMAQQQQQQNMQVRNPAPGYPQLFGNNSHGSQNWLNNTSAAGPSSSHPFQFHQLQNSHHENDFKSANDTHSPHQIHQETTYSPNQVYSPPLPEQPQNLQYGGRK